MGIGKIFSRLNLFSPTNGLITGKEYGLIDEKNLLKLVCFPSDRETAQAVIDHCKETGVKPRFTCQRGDHGKPVLLMETSILAAVGTAEKADRLEIMKRPIKFSAHSLTLTPTELGLALYADAPHASSHPTPSGPGQHG